MGTTRRSFLKVGVLAVATLAAGGAIYRYTQGQGAPQRFALTGEAKAVIDAIVPAMLGGVLPTDAAARKAAIDTTTQGVHQAILGLPLGTQKEVADLFGLLALGPARRFLAGIPDGWGQASDAQVAQFLQDWRYHRFATLQTGYHALHDLIIGAWYANPSSWPGIGYPGPVKELL